AGRPVVLVFYPGDWEPASSEQLRRCQRFAEEFARLGARLVAIAPDSVWCHHAFAREQGLRFPLLADVRPPGAVARACGGWLEVGAAWGRPLSVIDGAGRIRWSRLYPQNLVPSIDAPLAALRRLRETG